MCSVVGYNGPRVCKDIILEGLSRLEYRGYDSSGFACISPISKLVSVKSQGGIEQLSSKLELQPDLVLDSTLAIGHTRWATHGVSSDSNAHPHYDCQKTIAVVHNGIIENFAFLKEKLQLVGHHFISQTDTEVVAHLFEDELKNSTLEKAILSLVSKIQGAYALLIVSERYPDYLIAIRKSSPLCLGIGKNETFVASDVYAFTDKTNQVVFLPDESFALISKAGYHVYNFFGERIFPPVQKNNCTLAQVGKGNYAHYMLKEIYEQKRVIIDTVNFLRASKAAGMHELNLTYETINELQKINFVGCGTSWHAGLIAEYFMQEVAQIPTQSFLASEFRYKKLFTHPRTLTFIISQSGETADSLEALRLLSVSKQTTVALTNVASSSMVREADGFLLTQAGQEIAVASTKAFTGQVAALYWIAYWIAHIKGLITTQAITRAEEELLVAAEVLENSIERYKFDIISRIAPHYVQYKNFIFLGRHISFPFALEAALKLKEIAYVFVDCYPAGELKHGPLALIDQQTPVVLFSSLDETIYKKLCGNAQEVKARSGHLIIFAFEHQKDLIDLADTVFIFPKINSLLAPLIMTGLVQFFVYQIATILERPIDRPRNLAKSVTVE
ncbi:MAG: glutamine--fructose-6-phosphate transaminase (isomerizing) [Candidatus Babeliaceae bacterium]|nr:glutamine--fructose-6-phosphate transaminase (isomerizing) [Candidatus Babeliaceae bacterium]